MKPAAVRTCVQRCASAALRVVQGVGAVGVERAGEQAAAEAADAEAGGLFGGEQDEFDGAARARGRCACSARMASRPPSTPTVPSYMPAWGMASMWEPVATAGRSGSVPGQRKKVLPTASSRTAKPASSAELFEPGAGARDRRR